MTTTEPYRHGYVHRYAKSIVEVIRYEPAASVFDVAQRLGLTHGGIAATFAVLHREGFVQKTAAGWEATGKRRRLPRANTKRARAAAHPAPARRQSYDLARVMSAPLSPQTEQAINDWKANR